MSSNYFIHNRETGKLELHFEKSAYDALTDEQRADIKGAFLWGRRSGCWISRAKEPNLWHARRIAAGLGLEDAGAEGERLTFAEQIARKQERAAARADRCEDHAAAADRRGEKLCAPIESRRGDTAFFTQPIINTSAGRAFGRQRARMFEAFDRGIEEFRKSEYWQQRAETARRTASGAELSDKGFIQRRIDEAAANVRKLKKSYDEQSRTVSRIEAGEELRNWSGDPIDLDAARENLENWADRLESELDKLGFYQDRLAELGGVTFGRDNLRAGDLLIISRWREPVRFVRGGPKNFTYEFTLSHMRYADGSPMCGQAAYAEIIRRADEPQPEQPEQPEPIPAPVEQAAPAPAPGRILTPEEYAALITG